MPRLNVEINRSTPFASARPRRDAGTRAAPGAGAARLALILAASILIGGLAAALLRVSAPL